MKNNWTYYNSLTINKIKILFLLDKPPKVCYILIEKNKGMINELKK